MYRRLSRQQTLFGAATILLCGASLWWLHTGGLPEPARIVPRLSLLVVATGGLLMVVNGLRGKELPAVDKTEAVFSEDRWFLVSVVMVLTALGIFSYFVPRVGLGTSTFVSLALGWLVLARFRSRSLHRGLLIVFALLLSLLLYLFATRILDLYLPDAWLF